MRRRTPRGPLARARMHWRRDRLRLRTWWQHREERASRLRGRQRTDPVHRPARLRWGWIPVTLASALVGWLVFAVVMAILDSPGPGFFRPQSWCQAQQPRGYYCAEVKNFLCSLATVALGITVFLLWRYRHVRGWYRRRARRSPEWIVTSSGRGVDPIVGRDELCDLLMQRLRDREPQPLLLVGGVGTGKTITLTRLAGQLAHRGVLPIGLEMHTVGSSSDLDFLRLAGEQFRRTVDARLRAEGDADKIWRQLRRDHRIAVLADGLEEADVGGADRDSVLRQAIRRAAEDQLPLVIASRPDAPLRNLDAFLVQLEPLAEGAALDFVLPRDRATDRGAWGRVARLVKAVDVADSPAYLKIIGELREAGRLDGVPAGLAEVLGNRVAARWWLLERWREALVAGDIRPDYGVPKDERRDAFEVLSALACVGLVRDSLEARIGDLDRDDGRLPPEDGQRDRWRRIREALLDQLRHTLVKTNPDNTQDLGLAANTGYGMGIVVRQQDDTVRFQHGVIQAYLGSRFLGAALARLGSRNLVRRGVRGVGQDPDSAALLEQARAADGAPGRQLLAALTLYCHDLGHRPSTGTAGARAADRAVAQVRELVDWLMRTACEISQPVTPPSRRDDVTPAGPTGPDDGRRPESVTIFRGNRTRAVEMFATALEIDADSGQPRHRHLVRTVAEAWPAFYGDHSVTDRPLEDAKLILVRRFGNAAGLLRTRRRAGGDGVPDPAYRTVFEMVSRQPTSYLVQLTAVRDIARGGGAAVRELRDVLSPDGCGGRPDLPEPLSNPCGHHGGAAPLLDREPEQRERVLDWLAPMLYLHVGGDGDHDGRETARGLLRDRVDRLARDDREDRVVGELELARGFRMAANCRVFHDRSAYRMWLVEEAETALRHCRFWYAQLALVQALTLLWLPEDPERRLPTTTPASDPRGLVDYWLGIAGQGAQAPTGDAPSVHPLVREAGDLCVQALRSGHPERYCWVDERDVVRRLGSSSPDPVVRGQQESWLPESVGWGVLSWQARRLLADVMLLLNLADRGAGTDRVGRLNRSNRPELPPCLTVDRTPMSVDLGPGSERAAEPGSTCFSDCVFRLCPLPPKGQELTYPMDELFCTGQVDLGRWWRRWSLRAWYQWSPGATWRSVPAWQLRDFWRRMSRRMLPAWRK